MDILDEELIELWKCFEKYQLKFIMVGGFATNLHGFSRTTADCDIWIKDTLENRKKLRLALEETEKYDFEAVETMDFVPGWSTIKLFSGIDLDIMTNLKSLTQDLFDISYEKASVAEIYALNIRFLHINQLIEEKKSTNRPKDKVDVEQLEIIRQNRNSEL